MNDSILIQENLVLTFNIPKQSMYGWKHILVFALTFFAYSGLHSMREGWAFSKTQIKEQFNIDSLVLGLVDTLYLIALSVGMIVTNHYRKFFKLKYFVSIGLITSSTLFMSVAFSYMISGELNQPAMVVLMTLNGFFQSTGWPGLISIMVNWFQKQKNGVIMAVWAINSNIGNILSLLICNTLKETFKAPWTYNFIVTGTFTITIAILIIFFLEDSPKIATPKSNPLLGDLDQVENIQNEEGSIQEPSIGTQERIKNQEQDERQDVRSRISVVESLLSNQEETVKNIKKMNIFRAFCFPGVPFYVIGYSMLKGCIYGLLFWLPTYLADNNLDEQKGYISAMIDTGSFIGGLYIGYLGDKYRYRALFLSPLLFVSSIVMFISAFSLNDIAWQYYIAMFSIGMTIGGPYNIIRTVITIDLGKKIKEIGGDTGTVSALIEGTAAIFAALSQTIIPLFEESQIFYIFFVECTIACAVLSPLLIKDFRSFKRDKLKKLKYFSRDSQKK